MLICAVLWFCLFPYLCLYNFIFMLSCVLYSCCCFFGSYVLVLVLTHIPVLCFKLICVFIHDFITPLFVNIMFTILAFFFACVMSDNFNYDFDIVFVCLFNSCLFLFVSVSYLVMFVRLTTFAIFLML